MSSRLRRDRDVERSRRRRDQDVRLFQTLETETFNLKNRDEIKTFQKTSPYRFEAETFKTTSLEIWCIVSRINLLHYHINVFHLTCIICLYTTLCMELKKLKMLTAHCVVRERNSRIYPTSTVAWKFARFESSWLQTVRNIATESVQNMHHQSGPIDDATDEWLPQWQHDPTWPTPFLVAVSVCSDQWCVFWTPSLKSGEFWRLSLRWDKFWNFCGL